VRAEIATAHCSHSQPAFLTRPRLRQLWAVHRIEPARADAQSSTPHGDRHHEVLHPGRCRRSRRNHGNTAGGLGPERPGAQADFKFEKCFGVAKAGKNDCQTAASSCAGTSKRDGQADAWVYLPAGSCGKIVGGSLGKA
jgi:hypothetical protein